MLIRFALPLQGEGVFRFYPSRCGGLLRIALAGRRILLSGLASGDGNR
ncbi:MAG: hypothetical protein LBK82_17010 [Planctomycetaceae bacterium]|nr:hypothetical protein [Planctomycetaceae bacterium]